MNLYEVTGNILALQNLLESGEFSEADLKDTLELNEAEYANQLEWCCKVIKNLEKDIDGYKNESRRMLDKVKTLEDSVAKLKQTMFDSMKSTGIDKVKGELFTVAIQKNGGKLPVIVDVDVDMLPEDFITVTKKANLQALDTYLTTNPDCKFAHHGERGESLRIKF